MAAGNPANFSNRKGEEYSESVFYDANILQGDSDASGWFYVGKVFFLMAICVFGWAEYYWDTVPQGSIGIGTSGYALVLYTRALALAVMGLFCIAAGIAGTRFGLFRFHLRSGRHVG